MKRFVLRLVLTLALGISLQPAARMYAQTEAAGESTTPAGQSQEANQQEQDANEKYRQSPVVVSLGRKLGLNAEQSATTFEVLNFVVLVGALGWALVKVLPKAIRGRNEAIRKDITEAEVATKEARARLDKVEQRLSKLDDEIAAMRSRAEQDAAAEEQRLKASVEDEKRKIIAAAEQEIATATLHAQQQLKQHAAELAIEQAARKLVVSADTDRLLVQSFAQQLTGEKKDLN